MNFHGFLLPVCPVHVNKLRIFGLCHGLCPHKPCFSRSVKTQTEALERMKFLNLLTLVWQVGYSGIFSKSVIISHLREKDDFVSSLTTVEFMPANKAGILILFSEWHWILISQ